MRMEDRCMKLLIVDPEVLERSVLTQLCQDNTDVQVVGEADSGVAAIQAAENLQPDLMLLDVELPDMTGFDVLRAARRKAAPLAIMLSAHAGRFGGACEPGVIGYLVKPIGTTRFTECLDRARQRCRLGAMRKTPSRRWPQAFIGVGSCAAELLVGERGQRLYPLKAGNIDYINSDANYVTFHVADEEFISRDSVKRLAGILAESGFVRIERSLLVNVASILYAQRTGRGTYAFTLTSGRCLRSGATYRDEILRVLPLEQRCSVS